MNIRRTPVAALAAITLAVAACGSAGDDTAAGTTTPSVAPEASTTLTDTTAPPAREPSPTTIPKPTTTTAPAWKDDVASYCDELFSFEAVASHDGTAPDIVRYVSDLQASSAALPDFGSIPFPAEVQGAQEQIVALLGHAEASVTRAGDTAVAGDAPAAMDALAQALDDVRRVRGQIALAGAECSGADPARAQAAALNVLTEGDTFQANSGFGSIWASQTGNGRVTRLDPITGKVIATIDVGTEPAKLQPADGRMWVRTAARYVAVDPATNTVVATLDKAAVGPNANRSFAMDGAMWICDGQQLHRYDPTSLQLVATIELGVECEEVYAADGVVVAYRFNLDVGQTGTSAAAFVDPTTNSLLATVPLPVDVGYVAVLDDAVFFPGWEGSTAVVVDRSSWTVSATPDLGRPTAGGLSASDGTRIYVPAAGHRDVLVVDADSYAVVDTIETLGNNAPVLLEGSLWTADSWHGLIQRHDELG